MTPIIHPIIPGPDEGSNCLEADRIPGYLQNVTSNNYNFLLSAPAVFRVFLI